MNRVAVVTGAARGIGAAICDELEAAGWQVVAVDRDASPREGAMLLDLADPHAIATGLGGLRPVHALVNNAARQLSKPLLETTAEEWDAVLAVNLRAPFLCIRALAAQLVATQGSVVNVSSVHAGATSESVAAYAASKGGLNALTRAAALELSPRGVRVNAVMPGAIETRALSEGFARWPDGERSLIQRTPLGRVGQPGEIAKAVAFLLDSERSGFMTGQCMVIDGGAMARLSTE